MKSPLALPLPLALHDTNNNSKHDVNVRHINPHSIIFVYIITSDINRYIYGTCISIYVHVAGTAYILVDITLMPC